MRVTLAKCTGMSTHEQKISPLQSATFREYILLPRNTRPEHNLTKINLNTRLSDRLPLSIPFMSAAMESVTGVDLAVALALRGGLGILPAGKVEVDDHIDMVRQVKGYRSGFETRYIAVRPETTLAASSRA